ARRTSAQSETSTLARRRKTGPGSASRAAPQGTAKPERRHTARRICPARRAQERYAAKSPAKRQTAQARAAEAPRWQTTMLFLDAFESCGSSRIFLFYDVFTCADGPASP